ncbi:MAG: tRNA pseudouridine(38-40) synthase TruA [Planctomycetaceae bacterium]
MPNLRLTLAYDGAAYVGWQVQPNGVSVQSVVERAIHRLTGEECRVLAAGRTDSGVHALGQVANFHTNSMIPVEKFVGGLQRFLPDDVIVRDVREVPAEFHATYSAKRKRYRYVIHNSRIADPFLRRYAWRFGGTLDAAAMHAAAQALLGTHDFRAFESQWPNKATSVRTVLEATVRRVACWAPWSTASGRREPAGGAAEKDAADFSSFSNTGGGPGSYGTHRGADAPRSPDEFVVFDIVADGFLYNMVRAILGTLVEVGRGKWTADDVRRILAAGDRDQSGDTAPACGLYLVRVDYE